MSKPEVQGLAFPRPVSPAKDALKPNPHPYPIKTTSTALLTRSNSSPRHNVHHSGNSYHYVPSSPSPTSSRINSRSSPSPSGHRYSRSLTSDLPRPLPVPPSPTGPVQEEWGTFDVPPPKKLRRADTLPSPGNSPKTKNKSSGFSLEDLPSNPKTWTPSQLAIYLATALRVRSGDALDLPERVTSDIANFVRDTRINGRAFLRLSEAELEIYGINKLWRSALLTASRNLRHNVVKGQIWGFNANMEESPHSPRSTSPPAAIPEVEAEQEDDDTPQRRTRGHQRRTSSASFQSNPFVNGTAFYDSASSASSVEDLSRSQGTSPVRGSRAIGGNYRNGRVQGMVSSFERSSSDEGYVRERTGSSASTSSVESLPSDDEGIQGLYETARSRQRPLPIPPSFVGEEKLAPEPYTEEPSIEELLATSGHDLPGSVNYALRKRDYTGPKEGEEFINFNHSSKKKKRGVLAWEADPTDIGIITVKRVDGADETVEKNNSGGNGYQTVHTIFDRPPDGLPDISSEVIENVIPLVEEMEPAVSVIAPTLLEVIPPNEPVAVPLEQQKVDIGVSAATAADIIVAQEEPVVSAEEEACLIAEESRLQEQVDATRTLIEMFKARLADVEQRIDDMETRENEHASVFKKQEEEFSNKFVEKHTPPAASPLSPRILVDPQTLHGKLISGVLGIRTASSPTDDDDDDNRTRQLTVYDKLLNPKSIAALPSYVILVSLGMCAVILRVVLRRTVGGRGVRW